MNAKEVVGFRIALLGWALSTIFLLTGGYFYYKHESELGYGKEFSTTAINCRAEIYQRPVCTWLADVSSNGCSSLLKLCDQDAKNASNAFNSARDYLDAAYLFLWIWVIANIAIAISFYGIRWALTGRIKPLFPPWIDLIRK